MWALMPQHVDKSLLPSLPKPKPSKKFFGHGRPGAGRLDDRRGSGQFQTMWHGIVLELFRYLRAAPFPHLTTVTISRLAIWAGGKAHCLLIQAEESWMVGVWMLLAVFLVWGAILCQADALSRYREFKRVRGILARYGFRPRVFGLLASSRCQRDAALLAARETGCRAQARRFFQEMGYRWYHILPDAIVANPLAFFHPWFLRSTFVPGKNTPCLIGPR